ncbi:MAG: DUF167 domain-containing protein [Deltaproteobacteria bacterium]|nr:DUF167 domain-containing protein [Deltaproteobacteria bacterium]
MVDPVVSVKVLPRSSINKIVGFEGDMLKVKVKSAPVDGLANRDLILVLSKSLKLAKEKVEIISSHRSRLKKIRFYGIKKDDLFLLLNK